MVISTKLVYHQNKIWQLLQSQDLRVGQEKEPYIWVNTRKLNRELCIKLSTLYAKLQWSILLLL